MSIIIKKDLIVYRQDPYGFFRQPIGSIKQKVGGGTGFFVRKDGTIITNKHVVQDTEATYTIITNDHTEYDAKVIAIDPLTDLALLKIVTDFESTPLSFVSSEDDIKVWQFAIAIGNALAEFQNSVSLGVISGKERTLQNEQLSLSGLLQTDAAINPGNSGGPLVNIEGKVMGINTAISTEGQGLGFSIPLSAKRIGYILESIDIYGEIKRPFIGINYIPISEWVASELNLMSSHGAYILNQSDAIVPGSSAEIAGIKPGEIILEIDGQKIDLNHDLNSIIQNKIPEDIITLTIMNPGGETRKIELELGAY